MLTTNKMNKLTYINWHSSHTSVQDIHISFFYDLGFETHFKFTVFLIVSTRYIFRERLLVTDYTSVSHNSSTIVVV